MSPSCNKSKYRKGIIPETKSSGNKFLSQINIVSCSIRRALVKTCIKILVLFRSVQDLPCCTLMILNYLYSLDVKSSWIARRNVFDMVVWLYVTNIEIS